MLINIKPLSVNEAWQGRRFKTPKYKQWESQLLMLLPNKIAPIPAQICLYIRYGFSTKSADVDNPTKPLLDVLQKKYGFNDRDIYELHIVKTIVAKGQEFISIDWRGYEQLSNTYQIGRIKEIGY